MIKQVIVVRKDLKMRRGKEIAQGCHASNSFLSDIINNNKKLSLVQKEWLKGSFTKITLKVNSEEELLQVYNNAITNGLVCYLITDSGKTEFNGVPTRTCLAIGPDYSDKIDLVTGNLELY